MVETLHGLADALVHAFGVAMGMCWKTTIVIFSSYAVCVTHVQYVFFDMHVVFLHMCVHGDFLWHVYHA